MDMMVSVDSPVAEANKLWDGGEIHECRMEFYGICKDCKKSEIKKVSIDKRQSTRYNNGNSNDYC